MPRDVPLDAKLSSLLQIIRDSRAAPKTPAEKRAATISTVVKLALVLANTVLFGCAFSVLAQDPSLVAKMGLVLLGLALIPTFIVTSLAVPVLVRSALHRKR
jgi:hypothetical protein